MAEAAISSAVKILGELVVQKTSFLLGVEEQVKWLKDELQRMQSFLKDASQKQDNSESIRNWVSEIREVAQDAEDAIETFLLKVDTPSRRGTLGKCVCFPIHLKHLNRVGEQVESIKKRLEEIERSRERYGIQSLDEVTDSSRRSREDVEWRRRLAPWQKDKHVVVGVEGAVEKLLQEAILEEREELSIAAIVGMGGIGKSTLAKKLYNHRAITDRFEVRAWVCVSSEFNLKEVIKELMLQLLDSSQQREVLEIMEKSPLPHIIRMFHERLQGKRYLVVVDDIWEDAHWQSLANAFPHEDTGSRLLLTSRSRDIGKCARHVHHMKVLNDAKSWELFVKIAFVDNNDGNCPKDLESIGRGIVKKCGGLPLAITVVGGLLSNRNPSRSKWETVLKEINYHLGKSGSSVSPVLELSYRNLSPQLKSCFLCLGFFREDAIIRPKKLVHLWSALGLIQQDSGGSTIEDIGHGYLDELVSRNMVQVIDTNKYEGVKSCQVHDLIRELSITKAKEEIGLEIVRAGRNSQSLLDKPRHLAIYCSSKRFVLSSSNNKHLRSLFFYGSGDNYITSADRPFWKSCELLRILELRYEGLTMVTLPETLFGALNGLRYLELRYRTLEKKLPRSLGRLKKLEVLDLSSCHAQVPNVIWKMKSLRHIYLRQWTTLKVPLRIDTLKNLQTLACVSSNNVMLDHIKHLTSLRKLDICLDSSDDVSKMLSSLENLVCLTVRVNKDGYLPSMDGLGNFVNLTELKLEGKMINFPNAADFPPNLCYLTLKRTYLSEDPMPVLEKLPKLSFLQLNEGVMYHVNEMVISDGGFPRLEVLILQSISSLESIRVDEERCCMPVLKRFELNQCYYLERIPEKLRLVMTINDERKLKLKNVNAGIMVRGTRLALIPPN